MSKEKNIINLEYIFVILISFFIFTTEVLAQPTLNIKSEYAILYNLDENTVLYELKPNNRVYIASMTKIMTALVALDSIKNLDEEFVMTNDMYYRLVEENASVAGFTVGEKVTYRDLLYGLLLPSGAEAAQGLAIKISGSIDKFVVKMNEKAKELKLSNTHFTNPAGLDNPDNYSSVTDVATILKEALKNPEFKKIFTTKEYTTSNKQHLLVATSAKYSMDTSFIDGSKTGFTYDAGLCMASISHHDGVNYLLVTAKAPYNDRTNHLKDAKTIYTYFFDNYGKKMVAKKGDIITTISLDDKNKITYYMDEDIEKYISKNCKLTKEFEGDSKELSNHVINEKIGEYVIKCDDNVIFKKDIKLVFEKGRKKDYKNIIVLGLIFLIIVLSLVLIKIKIKKRRKRRHK